MENYEPMKTPMNAKEKLRKEDNLEKVKEAIYRSSIGCLMYLTATRPIILHVVSILFRFMHYAIEAHFKVAKCVLDTLKGPLIMESNSIITKKFPFMASLIVIGQGSSMT